MCHPLTLLFCFNLFLRWRLFQRALEDALGLLPGSDRTEVVTLLYCWGGINL